MPWPLLIALILAFGIDVAGESGPLPPGEVARRLGWIGGGLAALAVVAFALGRLVAWRVARRGSSSPALRRAFAWGAAGVEFLTLAVYAWTIHWVDWPQVVGWGLGLRDA